MCPGTHSLKGLTKFCANNFQYLKTNTEIIHKYIFAHRKQYFHNSNVLKLLGNQPLKPL